MGKNIPWYVWAAIAAWLVYLLWDLLKGASPNATIQDKLKYLFSWSVQMVIGFILAMLFFGLIGLMASIGPTAGPDEEPDQWEFRPPHR